MPTIPLLSTYQHVLLPAFKADDKVLIANDCGSCSRTEARRIHTAASYMVEARALAPDGLLEPWHANLLISAPSMFGQ